MVLTPARSSTCNVGEKFAESLRRWPIRGRNPIRSPEKHPRPRLVGHYRGVTEACCERRTILQVVITEGSERSYGTDGSCYNGPQRRFPQGRPRSPFDTPRAFLTAPIVPAWTRADSAP